MIALCRPLTLLLVVTASTAASAQSGKLSGDDLLAPGGSGGAGRPAAAAVRVVRICDHEKSWEDKGSGGHLDVAFYRPLPRPGFYVIGGYAQRNYRDPVGCVMGVQELGSSRVPILVPPKRWTQVWNDSGTGANIQGAIWHAEPPSSDYVCVGSMAGRGHDLPSFPNYRCVHECLTRPVGEQDISYVIWWDKGTGAGFLDPSPDKGADSPVSMHLLPVSQSYFAIPGHNPYPQMRDISLDGQCPG